ncbi:MAG: GTPase domain-containing protein, partial [Pseudomonadota bacterium]
MDSHLDFDVIARLRGAAQDSALSASVRASASSLADRLSSGVRIFVMGPKGVGKSSLCDAIFHGSRYDNSPAAYQNTRLFGVGDMQGARLPDKTSQILVKSCPFGHAHLIDFAPDAAVTSMSTETINALETADIVIWCTQSFTSEEANTWARAADELKDHSILVLTQAERLAETGELSGRLSELQNVVAEEFHSLLPVTTAAMQQALATRS